MQFDALMRLLKPGENGQDAAEYALFIAFISLTISVAAAFLGSNLSGLYFVIAAAMPHP